MFLVYLFFPPLWRFHLCNLILGFILLWIPHQTNFSINGAVGTPLRATTTFTDLEFTAVTFQKAGSTNWAPLRKFILKEKEFFKYKKNISKFFVFYFDITPVNVSVNVSAKMLKIKMYKFELTKIQDLKKV